MKDLVYKYLSEGISRRGFLDNMMKTGITVAAAEKVLDAISSSANAQEAGAPPIRSNNFKAPAALALLNNLSPAASNMCSAIRPVKMRNSMKRWSTVRNCNILFRHTKGPAPQWPLAISKPRSSPPL